jgi:3-oxoacyl-[acyl-carrier-protein] synthase III
MKRNARILSSGMAVPEKIVPNSYFNTLLGEDVDTWLQQNVQIYNRRWCEESESVADLVVACVSKALDQANITPEEVDLLIVATDTPEYLSPSTASVVQHRMGLTRAGTFDVNTACAGFVTALDIGSKYIQSDTSYSKVVVVGAYTMSKFLNLSDKKTVTLFADGAAAVVLGATEGDQGFLASSLATRGEYHGWMGIYAGGSCQPLSPRVLETNQHKLQFVKRIPSEINPEVWTAMIRGVCQKAGVNLDQIDHFFFTQININSIFATMDALGLPRDKAATIMHEYGYTGSACIPMAFDEWWQKGLVKAGDLVLFMGSGGGLAFGTSLFRI